MSTGIVSAHVSGQGFVIGADGLRQDARGAVISLSARKIFAIEGRELLLAYAWAGHTNLLDSKNNTIFNFVEESAKIGEIVEAQCTDRFSVFVSKFADLLYHALYIANKGDKVPDRFPAQNAQVARALLVGYFRGSPCRAQVEFRCRDHVLTKPHLMELHENNVPVDFNIFSGSAKSFDDYRSKIVEPLSLRAAADLVCWYLELCIANQRQFDDCKNIGGHIHIATMTPNNFEWTVAPI